MVDALTILIAAGDNEPAALGLDSYQWVSIAMLVLVGIFIWNFSKRVIASCSIHSFFCGKQMVHITLSLSLCTHTLGPSMFTIDPLLIGIGTWVLSGV